MPLQVFVNAKRVCHRSGKPGYWSFLIKGILQKVVRKKMKKPQRSVDRVYALIKSMVVDYEIPPGHHIHIEEIANQLNVSVTPVREALNRLLTDGLIERRAGGRGFFNRHIALEEMRDLFQLRCALAISAIHIVLKTDLADSIEQLLASGEDVANSQGKSSIRICSLLIEAINNQEMIKIFDNITNRIKFIWGVYAKTESGKNAIAQYQVDLKEALLNRDLERSTSLVYQHVARQISELETWIDHGVGQAFRKHANGIREGEGGAGFQLFSASGA
jgi:DNA-binding GntR family transcriptional regulator